MTPPFFVQLLLPSLCYFTLCSYCRLCCVRKLQFGIIRHTAAELPASSVIAIDSSYYFCECMWVLPCLSVRHESRSLKWISLFWPFSFVISHLCSACLIYFLLIIYFIQRDIYDIYLYFWCGSLCCVCVVAGVLMFCCCFFSCLIHSFGCHPLNVDSGNYVWQPLWWNCKWARAT